MLTSLKIAPTFPCKCLKPLLGKLELKTLVFPCLLCTGFVPYENYEDVEKMTGRVKVAKINPKFCKCESPKPVDSEKVLARCKTCGLIIGGKRQ